MTSKPAPHINAQPVVPRDAASLMLLREGRRDIEVLMGVRHTRSTFMPDVYVFPGGKIETEDWTIAPARPLNPKVREALRATVRCSTSKAAALANAAIRETYEEVGLMLARPGPRQKTSASAAAKETTNPWNPIVGKGLLPDHGALRMIGRAITPTNSPQRFHARFLAAEADATLGKLAGSDELQDVGFRTLDEALKLPIIDVTEAMLKQVRALSGRGLDFLQKPQKSVAFASYRNQKMTLRQV